MIEYSKHSIPDFNTMPVYYGHVNHQLWNWTLAGLGYLTPELAEKETKLYNLDDEELLFNHIKYLDEQTKNSLSFQDFIMGNNEEAKNKFKDGN